MSEMLFVPISMGSKDVEFLALREHLRRQLLDRYLVRA
jgi:hypothetical protein